MQVSNDLDSDLLSASVPYTEVKHFPNSAVPERHGKIRGSSHIFPHVPRQDVLRTWDGGQETGLSGMFPSTTHLTPTEPKHHQHVKPRMPYDVDQAASWCAPGNL